MKVIFFLIFLVLGSCSLQKFPKKWAREGIVSSNNMAISWKLGDGDKNLNILYNGCGGVAIEGGGETILTDPYFSNNSFFKILLGKIKTDTQAVKLGLERMEKHGIEPEHIRHLLVAHSHYDHLLDLPFLYNRQILNRNVKIYGSNSAFNAVKKFIPGTVFDNLEGESLYSPVNQEKKGSWIYLSDQIRILPIEGNHAPHFWNIHMMKGEIAQQGIRDFDHPTDKTYAPHWKDGKVFSFLIDYLDAGEIVFRIFHQSSSCDGPYGLPPAEEIKKRKVDVALLGVASAHNTNSYPEDLIKHIHPKKVIFIHWEDFFRPLSKPPKTVRFTNFNTFFKRVEKTYGVNEVSDLKDKIVMPHPGTLFKITY